MIAVISGFKPGWKNVKGNPELSSVHTELLAIAMQNWVENFAKDLVEYPFFAMYTNANSIANVQWERTLRE